jgi:hypothetical protein
MSAGAIAVEALSLPATERTALVLCLAERLDEQHDTDAEIGYGLAGRINPDLERAGRTIGMPDVMSAAIGL